MTELREYQKRLLGEVRRKAAEYSRILITAPTGAGKTVVLSQQLGRFVEREPDKTALYVVHRRQLVEQTARVLERNGVPATIVMAGYETDFSKRVFVVSRDTWHRRKHHLDFGKVGLIIFDEAHIGVEAQRRMVEALEPRWVLGYTATPTTLSGPGLGALYEVLVQGPSYDELIGLGYLVPTFWVVAKPLDTSGLRISSTTGDYVVADVVSLVKGQVLADVHEAWAHHAGERTVVFLPTVDIAHTVAARFGNMGVPAAVIDWSTRPIERARILNGFREGKIKVLCNVDVFSEGWDEPLVDTIILANPTRSLARHLQRIGRGMRPAPGKSAVRIIDLVGAQREHGIPEDISGWELEPERKTKKEREKATPLVKRKGLCPVCRTEMKAGKCENCGFTPSYLPTLRELEVVGRHVLVPDTPGENASRMHYYLSALGFARERGYKDGWAAHMYKHKYGVWPPFEWKRLEPIPPSNRMRKHFERAIRVRRRRGEPLYVWKGKV